MAVFERDTNFGNLFLAKLKTAITFASGIRTTIIIYAFGVENNFPYYDNGFCRLGSPKLQKIICLLSFFFIFQVLFSYFSKLCLCIFHIWTLKFCLKFFVLSFHDFRVFLIKFQLILISFEYSCSFTPLLGAC